MTPFLLALLSHALGDFVFQSEKMSQAKDQLRFPILFKHSLHIGIITFILMIGYGIVDALLFAIVVAISHFVLDLLKASISMSRGEGYKLSIFIIDQLCHLLIIAWLVNLFSFHISPNYLQVLRAFGVNIQEFLNHPWDRWLLVLVGYVYVSFGGSVMMKRGLHMIYRKVPHDQHNRFLSGDDESGIESYVATGRIIGILERTLIYALFMLNQLPSIAWIIAAKSLARFRNLNDKAFAEYYLIGTLLSVLIALVGGALVHILLR